MYLVRKMRHFQNVLDSNKCGVQSNAEDFTKQFMSDFFGQGAGAPAGGGEGGTSSAGSHLNSLF